MSVLIVYAGKNGSTEKAANLLAKRLDKADVCDLSKTSKPKLSQHDTIVIGSCVRAGRVMKQVRRFVQQNKDILMNKKYALFLCSGFEKTEQYLKENYPPEVVEKAFLKGYLGGELLNENIKGLDRFVINMVSKAQKGDAAKIDEKLIDAFALSIKEQL